MKLGASLLGGLAGAVAVTLIHETLRRKDPDAPRMDKLGMEAMAKGLDKMDEPVPEKKTLFHSALVSDILSNALYYSLAGIGKTKNAIGKGGLLGAAAGIGAVLLPKPMGLNPKHSGRTPKTKVMSVALYLIGGLVASKVTQMLSRA